MEQNKVEAGEFQAFGVYQAGCLQTQSYIGNLEAQAQAKTQPCRQTGRQTEGQPHRWTSVAAYRAGGRGQTQMGHGHSRALAQTTLFPSLIGQSLTGEKKRRDGRK